MTPSSFAEYFARSPIILGEGAMIERLRRDSALELDPFVVNSAFIYEQSKRSVMEAMYREYADIGRRYNLPMLLSTPTWRAGQERIANAGYAHRDVNADNFRFLDQLRAEYGAYADKIVICGLLSCRGDAYNPEEALNTDAAREFHAWQVDKLAATGVDFVLAATLPALSEAMGLALALAASGKPYIISFVVRPEGTLLDGTPLKEAVAAIDESVDPGPLAFIVNCTHASFFKSALAHPTHSSPRVRERVAGLLANTAALNPEELDSCANLVTEDAVVFGQSVAGLHKEFGAKILGGCCGTDHRHIESLALQLAGLSPEAPPPD